MSAFFRRGLTALLVVHVGALLLLASTPPVSRDALVHHLAVPSIYLKEGRMVELPSMPYSYYPMNLDLLYLIPLYFGNDIGAKWIHMAFGLMTAALIFRYLKVRTNGTYASLGALLFLSIPIIIKLSITVYVDLGLIFFTWASIYSLLEWQRNGFGWRPVLLAGVFSGLALGTKYNGLIPLCLLTLAVPFIHERWGNSCRCKPLRSIFFGVLFLTAALILYSPWAMRNYLWTKNPVYPLYDNVFNPPSDEVEKSPGLGVIGYRRTVYGESWLEILLLPIRIFIQGQDGVGRLFDGRLSPALLVFPIAAVLRRRDFSKSVRREIVLLSVFSGLVFFISFFATVLRIRYIVAIVPPVTVLAVLGIHGLVNRVKTSETLSGCVVLTVCVFLLLNGVYLAEQFRIVKPMSYLSGRMNPDQYIAAFRPEYPVFQYVNENLPEDSLILFVFLGKRGYRCNRRYVPDSAGEMLRLQKLFQNSESLFGIRKGLRARGITHLLIHTGFFDDWVSEVFTEKERKRVADFFSYHTEQEYAYDAVALFRIE